MSITLLPLDDRLKFILALERNLTALYDWATGKLSIDGLSMTTPENSSCLKPETSCSSFTKSGETGFGTLATTQSEIAGAFQSSSVENSHMASYPVNKLHIMNSLEFPSATNSDKLFQIVFGHQELNLGMLSHIKDDTSAGSGTKVNAYKGFSDLGREGPLLKRKRSTPDGSCISGEEDKNVDHDQKQQKLQSNSSSNAESDRSRHRYKVNEEQLSLSEDIYLNSYLSIKCLSAPESDVSNAEGEKGLSAEIFIKLKEHRKTIDIAYSQEEDSPCWEHVSMNIKSSSLLIDGSLREVEDNPTEVFMHSSPRKCWDLVCQRLNVEIEKLQGLEVQNLPPLQLPGSLEGLKMFGFSSLQIIESIEALDPSQQCSDYWIYQLPSLNWNLNNEPEEQNDCLRTEITKKCDSSPISHAETEHAYSPSRINWIQNSMGSKDDISDMKVRHMLRGDYSRKEVQHMSITLLPLDDRMIFPNPIATPNREDNSAEQS
ncbi:putative lysine-specific demethylase [Nymphaea thermarum]|nr:putative lysine-specific demethylase [Nymphaea thermarum]